MYLYHTTTNTMANNVWKKILLKFLKCKIKHVKQCDLFLSLLNWEKFCMLIKCNFE